MYIYITPKYINHYIVFILHTIICIYSKYHNIKYLNNTYMVHSIYLFEE